MSIMDTEYDFLTPEFLHLIFFKQKSIVIFPHVDLKHLRALEAFTVGYNLIDLEATAIYNIREMIRSDSDSYSHTPNYHLIYNLDKEKAKQLLDLEGAHTILNITQNVSDLIELTHEDFIFYNKKSAKFLNYDFSDIDLNVERMILSLAKTYGMIRDELQGIKQTASKIYTKLMNTPDEFDIDKLTSAYTLAERDRIIEFTERYYDIILPDDEVKQDDLEVKSTKPPYDLPMVIDNPALDFTSEFDIIHSKNRRLFQVFITQLDEYRIKNVNQSNLELNELFTPSSLYNYLRRHHWSKGIPEEFLIQWKDALNMKGGLSEEEMLDFHQALKGLSVKNSIIKQITEETHSENIKEQQIEPNLNQIKREVNTHPEDLIPSITDFPRFKAWIMRKLNFIEEKLQS